MPNGFEAEIDFEFLSIKRPNIRKREAVHFDLSIGGKKIDHRALAAPANHAFNDVMKMYESLRFNAYAILAIALLPVLDSSQLSYVPSYTGALHDSGFIRPFSLTPHGATAEIGYGLPGRPRVYSRPGDRFADGDGNITRIPYDYAAIVHEVDPYGKGRNVNFLSKPLQMQSSAIQRRIIRNIRLALGLTNAA